jgi:hypothetical protein
VTDHERLVLLAGVVTELIGLVSDLLAATKTAPAGAAERVKAHTESLNTAFPEIVRPAPAAAKPAAKVPEHKSI